MPADNQILSIHLPSLIHRIGSKWVKQAQIVAQQHECQLKRVRRSRNWQIVGQASDVNRCLNKLKNNFDAEMSYLIKKIDTSLIENNFIDETLEQRLVRLITEQPTMTLSELMAQTNCSLLEARQARFRANIF
ncbi:ribosome recycling factor family protein [Vibrio sp. TH_r3]|uniref:ribosome recycling factor family protein n=1 Tax=Vibrio sp. TH_r3 TaxID=3082084 RepID=UPI0029546775|nr:ribosome recycling factor family protein [Vibrio sp. TH_r3]MDV7102816.1 ribosome recycling factor family protein [Vibrio sp. TH_r3]